MDLLLHTRDEGIIKTMEFHRLRIAPKKVKTVKSTGKVGSHSFFGCTRYNSYRLSSVEANDQWRLLRNLIEPFQQHFKEKTSPFGKEVLFHQDNARVHTTGIDGQIQRIPLLIASPAYSSDLVPYDYFLFPNLKK